MVTDGDRLRANRCRTYETIDAMAVPFPICALKQGTGPMMILVTYDVSTVDKEGRRRLTRVAKMCLDYGQRVQNSVFECTVDPAQWAELRHQLVELIDPQQDSLRFYSLGSNWKHRVEHVGTKPSVDLEGPLIA